MNKDFIEILYTESEYYDTVKNTILHIMKKHGGIGEHDLADCINEVYLEAMKKRQEVEEHPHVKGWLILAAKFVVKRYLKRRAIELKLFYEDDELIPKVADGDDEYKRLYLEFMDSLKANLKPSEYKLFTMKFIEERSVAEIAEELGKGKHALDSKISRLKEKVRKILYET